MLLGKSQFLSLLPCCRVAVLPCCHVAMLPCCHVAVLPCCHVAVVLPCCRVATAVLQCCSVAVMPCCRDAVMPSYLLLCIHIGPKQLLNSWLLESWTASGAVGVVVVTAVHQGLVVVTVQGLIRVAGSFEEDLQ
jgi:hypothetical protein